MNEWEPEEAILADFRQWLRQTRAADAPDGDEVAAPAVGWGDLVEAFTALRHELKLQTRSARGLQEQSAAAIDAMQHAVAALTEAPPAPAGNERDARRLAETLAGLHEAMDRGARAVEAVRRTLETPAGERMAAMLDEEYARLSRWRRWAVRPWRDQVLAASAATTGPNPSDAFRALADGYTMIQARLERAMREHELERIACVGRPADPHSMMVVAVVDDPQQAEGTVVEEVRPGYRWKGEVLRVAEVTAVRCRP